MENILVEKSNLIVFERGRGFNLIFA